MTIEQTITIPADHRIFLDLPPELPSGKAMITVTSETERRVSNVQEQNVPYGEAQSLRGLAKKMGSTLTVEGFIEMKREDLDLEEAEYRRLIKTQR